MCRNIANLRGLEPPATDVEIRAAALQFVRKVSAVTSGPLLESPSFRQAVDQVAEVTRALLVTLPPRRSPPKTVPPSRRRPTT